MTAPALDWATWRARWPNAAASRFVDAGGVRWHVQVAGRGPALLLVHGTGGATHSWRDLLPRLATSFTVVAPDLPGHGFSSRPADDVGLSLLGVGAALAALLAALGVAPRVGVGHSAGAAILLRAALDGVVAPDGVGCIVGLNAALAPPAVAYAAVAPLAGALATAPLVARAVSGLAAVVDLSGTLLDSAGTPLAPEQRALYRALVRAPAHVGAVLTMMARWELTSLARELPRLAIPVTLAAAADDPWVPAAATRAAAAGIPRVAFAELPGRGHLAHEADPAATERLVRDAACAAGVSVEA
ncbi:MAG: alpha/beta fold hydrolase BchO [Gemmatirosa sp.]